MKKYMFTLVFCIAMASTALSAANLQQRNLTEHEFYMLQHYKLTYPEEIFDYCINEHRAVGPEAGNCMKQQNKLKTNILEYAYDRLGKRSLAQGIYNECLDYYLTSRVEIISECVKTRVVLKSKLEDDIVANRIYQNCYTKWRKHGTNAIDTCSRNEANYYRDKGKLSD